MKYQISYCSALRICSAPGASLIRAFLWLCGGYGVCWYCLKTSVLTNRLLVRYVPLRFWPSESVYQRTPLRRRDKGCPDGTGAGGPNSICAGLSCNKASVKIQNRLYFPLFLFYNVVKDYCGQMTSSPDGPCTRACFSKKTLRHGGKYEKRTKSETGLGKENVPEAGHIAAAAFWSDFCRQCGAGNPGAQTAGEKAQLGIEAGNIRKNMKKDRRKSVDAGIQGNPL